jgi:hypothetical protein
MASKRAHGDSGINILMPGDTSCLLLHRGNFKIAAGIRDGRPATEDRLPSLVSGLNFLGCVGLLPVSLRRRGWPSPFCRNLLITKGCCGWHAPCSISD